MRVYRYFIIVFGVVFFANLFYSCNINEEKSKENNTTDITILPLLPEETVDEYTPFFWGYTADDNLFKDVHSLGSTDYLHPLDIGRKALFAIHAGAKENDMVLLGYGEKYLNFLMEYPYVYEDSTSRVYNYSFTHKEFKEKKWWSGMANSVVALAFLEGAEVYEDTIYYHHFEKAINGVIENVSDGGSGIEFSDSAKWYLEYVNTERNDENSYFVLNGFLFSLLAIDIIAEKTDNPVYFDAYEKGVNAFKLNRDAFVYDNESWTNYMLNPRTIESTHYSIYDVLLFKSLLSCTYNSVFVDEILKRQNILLNSYPIYKKKIDENSVFLFSCIGPPHPYWIDTYQMELRYYKNNEHIKTSRLPAKDFSIPINDRAFLLDTIETEQIDSIGVFALYNSDTLNIYKIGTGDIEAINSDKHVETKYQLSTLLNMEKVNNNNTVLVLSEEIEPDELNRGTIRLNLEKPLNIDKNRLFGVLFYANANIDNLMITIIDNKGVSANRYYIVPDANEDNLLLFNKLGFNNIESLDIENITELRIDVYAKTSNSDSDILIRLGDILCFENNFQLQNFFYKNDFYFPELELRGNIY